MQPTPSSDRDGRIHHPRGAESGTQIAAARLATADEDHEQYDPTYRDYASPETQVLGLITTRTQVLGLLTMTATYRMESGFRLRAYWYRTLTTNGRDTDVVMLGLGWGL